MSRNGLVGGDLLLLLLEGVEGGIWEGGWDVGDSGSADGVSHLSFCFHGGLRLQ